MELSITKKGISLSFGSKKEPETVVEKETPQANYMGNGYYSNGVFSSVYDGQNNLGEMGPAIKYAVDHGALAIRSWQMYLESPTYKTILKKLKDSVIGSGLKLQCQPKSKYLERKGIKIDVEKYNTDLEDMWDLYANFPVCDYADKDTLGEIHARAYLNAIAGGNVLVILRPINGVVKVQLVDAVNIQTPIGFGFATESKINYETIERINPETGNRVRWGIEISDTGAHVAYYVRVGIGIQYIRVEARGKRSGALMAYMLSDEEFRIDDPLGLPRLASGMEMTSQLARYQSAMVSAAEEIAKAPYYIFHKENTDDTDPRINNLTKAYDVDRPNNTLDYSAEGKAIANTISVSSNRTVANLTPGSELRALESQNQLHYEPFNTAITEQQAALAGIPPEIVASKFGSNFSASRAAFLAEGMRLRKEWDYQGNHFLQPILNLQLDIWVQTFEIDAPGYLYGLQTKNIFILNAYRHCTWDGMKLGHIDPLKEVKYWREVLGQAGAHLPLGSAEQATSALGNGDSVANAIQFSRERDEAENLNIPEEDKLTNGDMDDENEDGTKKEDPPPSKKK